MGAVEFDLSDLAGRYRGWQRWAPLLLKKLRRPAGVCLGESAVLSTCVHLLKQHQPGIVTVLTGSDAGHVFYRRTRRGQVFHLDVFHQTGEVGQNLVARLARQAIAAYTKIAYGPGAAVPSLADYVDVQTAAGGGRITGSLTYGRRPTLQRAHRNHVHLAALWPEQDLPGLFFLLAAVEQAIALSGLELRRVEGVEHDPGGTHSISMDDYSSPSDSMMREDDSSSGSGAGTGRGRSGGHGTAPPASIGMPPGDDQSLSRTDLHWAVAAMMDHLESAETVHDVLDHMTRMGPWQAVLEEFRSRGMSDVNLHRALAALSSLGLLRPEHGDYVFTARGRQMLDFLRDHSRELKVALRRAVQRRIRREASEGLGRSTLLRGAGAMGRSSSRRVVSHVEGDRRREISWPDSIMAAAARQAVVAPTGPSGRFTVELQDLREIYRVQRRPVDVFLLIDASASMSGERMRAAKTLARHMLLTTRDRVSVITFQERQVRVTVPLTRNSARVEQGLATIKPFGLTPMASGLAVALDYVHSCRPRNPLVILITDGIPTVPHEGKNPLDDAIKQASRWKGLHIGFTCIGLQPNERYLKDLIRAAGGSLHIVDELEARTLVAIASAERNRRVRRGEI